VDCDAIRFTKMLVVEAERYQEQRGMKALRLEVVRRASASKWPINYIMETRTSVLLNRDVDTLVALPLSMLPAEGRAAAAKKAIVSLPLWQKPAGVLKPTARGRAE
jgi:hypothetical protein